MKKIDHYTIFLEKKAEKEKAEKEKAEKEKSEKEKAEKDKAEKEKAEDSEKEEKSTKSKKENDSDENDLYEDELDESDKDDEDDEEDDEDDEDEDEDEEDEDEDDSENKELLKGGVKFEVKKIISEMFAFGKNVKFSGEQKGDEPEYVDFEISFDDFKLNYVDYLDIEYSSNILKKKQYYVALEFDSKSKEGSDRKPTYKIRFKIKIKPTSLIKFDTSDEEIVGWNFEDKPSKVISFIKQARVKFDWDKDRSILTMKKSEYNKLNKEQLKILINKEGAIKVRIK